MQAVSVYCISSQFLVGIASQGQDTGKTSGPLASGTKSGGPTLVRKTKITS